MKNLSENIDSEYPQKIFEIGRIFPADSGKIEEKESLCVATSPGNFTEARQSVEYLFRMIDKKIDIKEPETKIPGYFIDGRVAKIIFNNKEIGFLGEIHPKILKNCRMKMPVALCEIELDDLLNELTI